MSLNTRLPPPIIPPPPPRPAIQSPIRFNQQPLILSPTFNITKVSLKSTLSDSEISNIVPKLYRLEKLYTVYEVSFLNEQDYNNAVNVLKDNKYIRLS